MSEAPLYAVHLRGVGVVHVREALRLSMNGGQKRATVEDSGEGFFPLAVVSCETHIRRMST